MEEGAVAEIKARLAIEVEQQGSCLSLYEKLKSIDPKATHHIHPNDFYRIARALVVYELTGNLLSTYQAQHAFAENPFDTCKLAIEWKPRQTLYDRINARITTMVAEGLMEEVNLLLKTPSEAAVRKGLAYRHFLKVAEGILPMEEAITLTMRDSRHFAKRQITWFSPMPDLTWLKPTADLVEEASNFLKQWLSSFPNLFK